MKYKTFRALVITGVVGLWLAAILIIRRAAIVSVLPEPAPATTRVGDGGCSIFGRISRLHPGAAITPTTCCAHISV